MHVYKMRISYNTIDEKINQLCQYNLKISLIYIHDFFKCVTLYIHDFFKGITLFAPYWHTLSQMSVAYSEEARERQYSDPHIHPGAGEEGVCCGSCFFFSFVFLGPHLWPMEVPRLGVQSEL